MAQGHHWATAKCAICERKIKTRQVTAMRPPYINCCGPCARLAEGIPFPDRTLQSVRAAYNAGATATA